MKVAPSRLHPSPREPPSFPASCLKHVLDFFFVLWGRVASYRSSWFLKSMLVQWLENEACDAGVLDRVANITDFSVEVRNLENDPYFSRFL